MVEVDDWSSDCNGKLASSEEDKSRVHEAFEASCRLEHLLSEKDSFTAYTHHRLQRIGVAVETMTPLSWGIKNAPQRIGEPFQAL